MLKNLRFLATEGKKWKKQKLKKVQMDKWRLRYEVLVVFIRSTDKYLRRSINKGFIEGPSEIKDNALFVYDDVSALGMSYPQELIELLEKNQATTLLNAQDLATDLVKILPVDDLVVMQGGGVLAYLFLQQAGYQGALRDVVEVARTYENGIPNCKLISSVTYKPKLLLDDIIASGQTIAQVQAEGVACLLASANVSKGLKGYRVRDRSTLPGVAKMYCPKFVNNVNLKPAILSLRYLMTKAIDNGDYSENYLARKFGGLEQARDLCAMIQGLDREPIDLLRRDYKEFLRNFGGIK
jgi:hypothetical protein